MPEPGDVEGYKLPEEFFCVFRAGVDGIVDEKENSVVVAFEAPYLFDDIRDAPSPVLVSVEDMDVAEVAVEWAAASGLYDIGRKIPVFLQYG